MGKVFLATSSAGCDLIRDELSKVLLNAGLEVIMSLPGDPDAFNVELNGIKCSIHILGNSVGEKDSQGIPHTLSQINRAKENLKNDLSFKLFIWNVGAQNGTCEPEQYSLINEIRNNIENNMIFTNVPSPVQLVDDIRSMLSVKEEIIEISDASQVFFMYNFIDEDDGGEIADMLSDILEVKPLTIGEEPGVDYGNASIRILKNSKLAVVFFSEASSWALPFIQQIWKMSGGASSKTPLLLIGDENNDENEKVAFNAPNVISKLVSLDLIPLEIKVAFDKLTAKTI